ncbi:MFS transporter [Pararhodospirillum oryzae]|uniref:MFS transporter n=1 Tax=Pararhodospirillum oryzae TaxID=478448 RepID=A0A512H5M9_9PROT|nr:MFS transporter [Pararhodospirillum oryzae]GEO80776.1 MFS transporter [Pararhodospirillum oryzae]
MRPVNLQALRLSFQYAALFGVVGIMLPYWPVWLASRGLGPVEIGLVTGITAWGKMLINPLAGQAADALGRPRLVMAALAAGSLALYAVISGVSGVWGLALVTLMASGLFAALMPLTETMTLAQARSQGVEYGRVRLWGSISFIVLSTTMGPLIDTLGPALVPWVVVGFLALVLAGVAGLPAGPGRSRPASGQARRFLTSGPFLLFLLSSGLIQAGHATYYTFATLHWRAAGLDGLTIGLLWAEGVVAEVILFLVGAGLVRRIGPLGLMGVGAACGIVRWSITATTTDPQVLMVTQVLHAGTFACAHLGAMHHLARTVPVAVANRAQALYSTICQGVIMGAAMSFAGPLYGALGGHAFFVDAGWCALGGGCALLLALRYRHRPAEAV